MRIQFLGTAGSSITALRNNSSILIDNDLLIDAGEGTTQRLLQLGAFNSIKTILISHLHVDHFIGIFSFLWKKWLTNEKDLITIYGPPNIQSAINQILTLTTTPVDTFSVEIYYVPLDPKYKIIRIGEISTIQVIHPIYTLAFRIDREKSVCYSSDTAPFHRIISLAKGCDLLIHDCSFLNWKSELAHKYYHSTPRDAAKIANKANVKKLAIFHISDENNDSLEQYKQEAEEFFNGEVVLANDMEIIEL